MGPDLFETVTKFVRIKIVFTRDLVRICYLVPNRSTYEGDPIWNRTVPVSNRFCVNRADP